MKNILWLSFFALLFVFLSAWFYFMASKPLPAPQLKVLSYSSFAGLYGPGPVLKKHFEQSCKCTVQWFLAEDSTALLQRFLMLKDIDIVIGWDQITKKSAGQDLWENIAGFNHKIFVSTDSSKRNNKKQSQKKPNRERQESCLQSPAFCLGSHNSRNDSIQDNSLRNNGIENGSLRDKDIKEKSHKVQKKLERTAKLSQSQKVLQTFKSDFFIPFDWSPIGFIYKDKAYKVTKLEDLLSFKGKISFPEPRSSNLGLQFYYGMYEHFKGDKQAMAQFLQALKSKVYGPVFSWSQSYGFFRKGQTQLSLSYLSSLLYHKQEKQEYFFAKFPSHPYHIEFFSISKKAKNKNLAMQFAQLLLSTQGQEILLKHNYMFPVSPDYTPPFPPVKAKQYDKLEPFLANKQELLKLWERLMH